MTLPQKSYALTYPSEPPVRRYEQQAEVEREYTGVGNGMATMASTERELGGDVKGGTKRDRRTR